MRSSGGAVGEDVVRRMMKDERRHFAFYYNAAKEWLTGNVKAQRVDRWMLDHVWVPVGKGVKSQEEVDALALYLFDDEQGEEDLLELDAKIGRLPGLGGIKLMSQALYEARDRVPRDPRWARRIIETAAWAIVPPKKTPVCALTAPRAPPAVGVLCRC